MAEHMLVNNFKLPRWDDLPSIDLYLDQILSLIDEWLDPYLNNEDKPIMTKTMVNNYVKHKYIPAPIKKRYSRAAVASLFVIAVLKPVYTIDEISRLIELSRKANPENIAYDEFCALTEEAVEHAFSGTTMPKVADPADPKHLFWNVCNSFACQLYVRYGVLFEDNHEEGATSDN